VRGLSDGGDDGGHGGGCAVESEAPRTRTHGPARADPTLFLLLRLRRLFSAAAFDVDIAVIGAGIVGLACARELLRRHPHLRLAVLEKEADVGTRPRGPARRWSGAGR